ncbi:MAG: nucleoside hydrolase [Acidobacteria bacterium]|nr:nucleoside hydrolase [Acidobacteriota bacterium]
MGKRLAIVLALAAVCAAAQSPGVIFDTDMGNDVDDALALGILHALESRGECRLLAVTITKDNPWSAVYVDLVNTFYGRAQIPVGMVKGGVTPEDSAMIRRPSERRRADGRFVYPRRLGSGAEAPEAVALIRRVLAAQPDGSVIIVQVGFSTNLARLLDSPADLELIRRKVKLLSVMAGNYVQAKPEFNVEKDPASAIKLFEKWPGPIVASGFEIGERLRFPAARIEHDFSWAPDHPVAEAYRDYMRMPYDRPTWDLTAALYAIRPDGEYFGLSQPGWIRADEAGRTRFEPDPAGRHRYLILNEAQRARTLETMILLASQPR